MRKTEGSTKTILKRAVIGLLIFVVAYTLISVALSAVVYSIIFENIPNDELPFGYDYADFADDYPRTEAEFSSGENTLRGYRYGAGNGAGVVIVANGVGSNVDSHLPEIMYFVDAGWQVLAYSGTGVGDSDGNSIIGLSQMRLDLLAAIDCVRESTDLPIVIYGHSAGGYAAASVLGERDVAGAVCIAGFNSPTETMYGKAKEYVGVLADIEKPILRLQHWFVFGSDGYVDAIDSINSTDTPVVVYQGTNDSTVTYPLSVYSHYAESTNPNAVFIETADEHTGAWLSPTAKAYVSQLKREYAELEKTPEKIAEFKASVDREKANELDLDFLRGVTEFFTASAEKSK